jgi:hypothetical protein
MTLTHAEVLAWFNTHIMPSEHRRKAGFWVLGDERAPTFEEAVRDAAYAFSTVQEFQASAQVWPLTKDALHPIIASAYQ